MLPAQIMFDAASAQIRPGKRVGDRAVARNHANIFGSIDENAVPGQELVDFVELWDEVVQKFAQGRDKRFRQVANLAADARVGSSEARASEQLEKVIQFFALGKCVEERRHRAEIERHRAEPEKMR